MQTKLFVLLNNIPCMLNRKDVIHHGLRGTDLHVMMSDGNRVLPSIANLHLFPFLRSEQK